MDVIIVGAGPVGLVLAFWLITAGIRITMYEGRTFTRGQVLFILREFYDTFPEEVRQRLKNEGIYLHNKNPLVWIDNGRFIDVHISLLQKFMLEHLQKYPNFILIPHFVTLHELRTQAKSRIIIIADGGGKNSVVRSLFSHPYRSIHVANSAVVTYEGKTINRGTRDNRAFERLRDGQHAFIIHRALPHYGHVGVQLSDQTYQWLISLPENQRLEGFFQTPEGKVAEEVLRAGGYIEVMRKAIGVFPIDLRTAKRFYYKRHHRHYFLVGDAAFTTHYFTGMGLNTGMRAARELVSLLKQKSEKWERYNKIGERLRDNLWDHIVPTELVDMSEIVKYCQGAGNIGRCIIAESRAHKNEDIIRKIRKRRLKRENL